MNNERVIWIKNEFSPVVMHPQGHGYFLLWDYQPAYDENGNEEAHGTCCMVHAPYRKPTVELCKYLITDYYNRITDQKIYDGFEFEGSKVYLTKENQFNYKALFDIAVQTNGANLPVKIKIGSDEGPVYRIFETVEDFQNFYYQCVSFINNCVTDGWDLKDSVDYSVFEEALKTVPDLPEDVDILTNRLGREDEVDDENK